jgi:hypothetical protein
MPRIVSYTYAEGVSHYLGTDTPPVRNATATIGSREQYSAGTLTYCRPSVPMLACAAEAATDQLREWQTWLTSETPGGTYTCTYSAVTRRVTVSGTVPFKLYTPEQSGVWSGFTQDCTTSYQLSWTGASQPACIAELIGVTVEPAENDDRVDLREYRHGRAVAISWGNHQQHRVTLLLSSRDVAALDPGYLVTGRVRVYPTADVTPYSVTNLDGYLDGWVVACTEVTEEGDTGELWSVTLLIATERG